MTRHRKNNRAARKSRQDSDVKRSLIVTCALTSFETDILRHVYLRYSLVFSSPFICFLEVRSVRHIHRRKGKGVVDVEFRVVRVVEVRGV